MAVNNIQHYTISNQHFGDFCKMLQTLFNIKQDKVLSDLKEASLDDSDKNNLVYLYNGIPINMDTVKLDDMTNHFSNYMNTIRNCKTEPPKAVDAVCINKKNEWFLIEFKNRPMYKKSSSKLDNVVISDIKKKMFESLWLIFSMDSIANTNLFSNSDVTDFSRNHITYIVVVSREKNPEEYHRIFQSPKNLYTPNYLKKYVGYYFKDVYMITENELANFIKKFKC